MKDAFRKLGIAAQFALLLVAAWTICMVVTVVSVRTIAPYITPAPVMRVPDPKMICEHYRLISREWMCQAAA